MYDISVVGISMSYKTSRTGIYRVVAELLKELDRNEELSIEFSNTGVTRYLKNTRKFLQEEGFTQKLNNKLIYPLPDKILGRGRRKLSLLYGLIGIDINLISYNEDAFEEADIFHTPFYKIPDQAKNFSNLKRCITIHDLVPILYPDLHNKRQETEDVISSIGDDYAICVSENTRNDLLNYDQKLHPDNVFVSHLAADPDKFYHCTDSEKFKAIKEKYHLQDNYFLSLCTLEPRKNLDRLIRCFNTFIKQQKINDLSLVLVGGKGWKFEKIFDEIEHSEGLRDRIIVTGWLPDDDLASIYSNAHSFYYISQYEGFGLPPLEAMQCGVATVTSNTSSLPEVVGDAAITVDPFSDEEICNAMHEFYFQNELRQLFRQKGIEQAEKFSWKKTGSKYVDIYKKILNWQE